MLCSLLLLHGEMFHGGVCVCFGGGCGGSCLAGGAQDV